MGVCVCLCYCCSVHLNACQTNSMQFVHVSLFSSRIFTARHRRHHRRRRRHTSATMNNIILTFHIHVSPIFYVSNVISEINNYYVLLGRVVVTSFPFDCSMHFPHSALRIQAMQLCISILFCVCVCVDCCRINYFIFNFN